jgi:GT2 family glycosyltransferase
MNEKPVVSAVIVNWNGAEHLRICLPSLLAQSFTSLEIIVVDNDSRDDSADVARQFQARWMRLEKNLGLAPALNRGAAMALGEFLLFVNNDMRFDRDFVSMLVETLRNDNSVFAADGMQLNWDGSAPAHMATRLTSVPSGKSFSAELVPGLYFYPEAAHRPIPVFMASAASMLVRRSFFDRLGGFDNRLPLGYEDVEICWRAAIQGWKIIYVPAATCWHRVGSSGRSPEGARFNFRGILMGRLLLATKLLPLRYNFLTWLASAAGLAKDLRRGRWQAARDRVTILAESAVLFPTLLREKRTTFRAAGTTARAQLQRLLELSAGSESRTWAQDLEREGGR